MHNHQVKLLGGIAKGFNREISPIENTYGALVETPLEVHHQG